METVSIVYEKHFSQLDRLQQGRCVRYFLVCREDGGEPRYGIRVEEMANDYMMSEDWFEITLSCGQVRDLLTFLYENSVSAGCCQAVIADLLETEDGNGAKTN